MKDCELPWLAYFLSTNMDFAARLETPERLIVKIPAVYKGRRP